MKSKSKTESEPVSYKSILLSDDPDDIKTRIKMRAKAIADVVSLVKNQKQVIERDIKDIEFSENVMDIHARVKLRGKLKMIEKEGIAGAIRTYGTREIFSTFKTKEILGAEKARIKNTSIGWNAFISFLWALVVVCAVKFTTIFLYQPMTVNGNSMNPTYENGNVLILDKFSKSYERYDNIHITKTNGKSYIKRIIGLPGETVYINKYGQVYINGKLLDEPFNFEPMIERGMFDRPITLKSDEYFCLGDNRNFSEDSRFEEVGLVKSYEISGEVACKLF